MRKRTGLCGVVVLLAVIGCKDRKLTDDLEWMDNTYNPHVGISAGHGTSGYYTQQDGKHILASGTTDTFKNDECNFEIEVKDNPSSVHSEMLSTNHYSFNLRDLDPASVKVKTYTHDGGIGCDIAPDEVCDWAEMEATTRNSRPVVMCQTHAVFAKLTGKDHDNSYTSKGVDVYLGFDNPEYAKKFASVFQDAVRRCGGTKGAAS
ncbi:MAG: hypothetical protein WCA10_05360 [Terracidiphilus sp.]